MKFRTSTFDDPCRIQTLLQSLHLLIGFSWSPQNTPESNDFLEVKDNGREVHCKTDRYITVLTDKPVPYKGNSRVLKQVQEVVTFHPRTSLFENANSRAFCACFYEYLCPG